MQVAIIEIKFILLTTMTVLIKRRCSHTHTHTRIQTRTQDTHTLHPPPHTHTHKHTHTPTYTPTHTKTHKNSISKICECTHLNIVNSELYLSMYACIYIHYIKITMHSIIGLFKGLILR
jgi:hypothetical protein